MNFFLKKVFFPDKPDVKILLSNHVQHIPLAECLDSGISKQQSIIVVLFTIRNIKVTSREKKSKQESGLTKFKGGIEFLVCIRFVFSCVICGFFSANDSSPPCDMLMPITLCKFNILELKAIRTLKNLFLVLHDWYFDAHFLFNAKMLPMRLQCNPYRRIDNTSKACFSHFSNYGDRNSIIVQNQHEISVWDKGKAVHIKHRIAPHEFFLSHIERNKNRNITFKWTLFTRPGRGKLIAKTFSQTRRTPKSIHEKFIRQCEDYGCKHVTFPWLNFRRTRREQTYRVNQIDLFKDGCYNWDITTRRRRSL